MDRIHINNRLFNVNGKGSQMLLVTLQLAFAQAGSKDCSAWQESTGHGLVLLWSDTQGNCSKLPAKLSPDQCLPFVEAWLGGDFARTVAPSPWCGNAQHDGHNTSGWQVYCEDWGHVDNNPYSICGIKPAFMWHGK